MHVAEFNIPNGNYMWQPAPAGLQISRDDIHVWRADLNLPQPQLSQLRATLSEDEHLRAARFYFERDRLHFIAARGILRNILAHYLAITPDRVKFSYSTRGKPSLANTGKLQTIEFNLSHSHGLALYAIALDRKIGIDLEYIRSIEAEQLAKRFFSDREYALISNLPPQEQQTAFFHHWTCKEAYLKATGDGLVGLEKIEVSLTEALLLSTDSQQPEESWSLKQLDPGDGYIAAVVVAGGGWRLHSWHFSQTPA